MSLIFDSFPTYEQAKEFAVAVRDGYGLKVRVFNSQKRADRHDPFPYHLTPPIVHVERSESLDTEREIREVGKAYGGDFAGT